MAEFEVAAYQEKLLSIWARLAQNSEVPGSMLIPYLGQVVAPDTTLMFLGFNPSCRYSTLAKYWKAVHHEDFSDSSLAWTEPHLTSAWLQRIREVDLYAAGAYRTYYAPFEKAAAALNVTNWAALDVLPLRVTRQAQLKSHFPINDDLGAFAAELVSAFHALLAQAAPRVVVVANAHASRFLQARFGLVRTGRRTFYACSSLPATTFLLSGMLSGQASLDVYSRERLLEDVRAALEA